MEKVLQPRGLVHLGNRDCKISRASEIVIRAFSDFKAFLYILIGGFSVAKAVSQNI